MSLESIRKCDQCGKPMAEGSRRFVFTMWIMGANGEEKEANTDDEKDLCSAACVLAMVNELVRKVS